MESQELASKFRQSVDAVVEKFDTEYEKFFSGKSPHSPDHDFDLGERMSMISKFLGRHRSTMLNIDVIEETCDYALGNFKPIERWHPIEEGGWMGIDGILLRFIEDVLSNTGRTFDYSENDFQAVYQRYETDLLSDTLPARWFVCLQGLQIEGDLEEVELEENVVIRKMTDDDLTRVANSTSPESIFARKELYNKLGNSYQGPELNYILELWYKIQKQENLKNADIGNSKQTLKERNWTVRDTLTALRLVNERQTVNFGQRFTVKEGAWQRSGGGVMNLDRPIAWNAGYELSQDDIAEVRNLYDLLQSKDFESLNTNLKMAVQRFNSATLRVDWRVEFSDLIIIMEALVSKKSVSGAEFAQRVAILLGDSFEERQMILQEVRELWENRSSVWGVAHGGGRTGLDDREEVLNDARRYSADCITMILELEREAGGLGNLLNNLEEKIAESRLKVEFPD